MRKLVDFAADWFSAYELDPAAGRTVVGVQMFTSPEMHVITSPPIQMSFEVSAET